MAMEALIAPLRRVALFQRLRPLQITEIARRAERRIFNPGQSLILEGEEAHAAILIVAGEAELTSGPATAAGELPEPISAGSLLAELAMFVETEHTSTVVARSIVRALVIPRRLMLELLEDDPDLLEHMTDQMVERLTQAADRLRGIDAMLAEIAARPLSAFDQVFEGRSSGHSAPNA